MSILVKVSERYVDASHSKHLVRITDFPTKFSLTKFGSKLDSVVILVKPLALATFVHCELESMGSEDDDLTPFDTELVEEEDVVVVLE
jgi:hypothetical protein